MMHRRNWRGLKALKRKPTGSHRVCLEGLLIKKKEAGLVDYGDWRSLEAGGGRLVNG